MRVNLKNEYSLLVILSLFLLVLVSDLTMIRTILGLPFVLLLPGYLLTVVLFPKANDLEGLDRAVLSVGLSIIMVPLIGLLENYLPSGISLLPMMFSLTFLNIILAVLGWRRRKKLPEEKRFVVTLQVKLIKWAEKSIVTKFIDASLLITCFCLLVTIFYLLITPKIAASFTEFYITGQNGVAAGYQEQLQVGEYGVVRAGVINNEQQKAVYKIEIRVDGELIQTIEPISLNHLEKWENTLNFKANKPKDAVKVEFLLFKDNQNTTPYRQLKLWVKVEPPKVEPPKKPSIGVKKK
jgi:uncharacterized membrane protein